MCVTNSYIATARVANNKNDLDVVLFSCHTMNSNIESNDTHPDAERNAWGYTKLMASAFNNQVSMVSYLLQHKANIDAQTHQGFTALMYAVWNNRPTMVEYLMKKGANKYLQTITRRTALSIAKENHIEHHKHRDMTTILGLLSPLSYKDALMNVRLKSIPSPCRHGCSGGTAKS